MTQTDNEKIDQELSKLLSEIQQWKNATARYRMWNIILFACFKVLIPLGSLAVAASAFSQLQGQPLFSPLTTLILAGLVVVLSGLDSRRKWDAGKKLSSRGWHVAARLGEKVGNEWSRGGVCRGKRSGYCPGEQLFLD